MEVLFWLTAAWLLLTSVVVIANRLTAPVLERSPEADRDSFLVSALIPARNEQETIGGLLSTLAAQTHTHLEILVYDDQSVDRTADVVREWEARDSRVRLIGGGAPAEGWVPKSWACHQLAGFAKGEIFLFLDADVSLSPWAVEAALRTMQTGKLQLLTCFSTQTMKTFGEYLIVPLMPWLLLTFLPLKLVPAARSPMFTAANGQFMCFDRRAYFAVGGHKRVRAHVVEDMQLARLVKRQGLKMMTALGGEAVFCRMYRGFESAIGGFSKNFFPGFQCRPVLFLTGLTAQVVIFTAPVVMMFFDSRSVWLTLLLIMQRSLISRMSGQMAVINVLLHPFQMLVLLVIGFNSVRQSLLKKVVWKGRPVRVDAGEIQ